ncbi:MAG: nucleotidyltransferase substrate binding protein [Chlamydiae bacterium]|nr:nucleotidyltransferase substrate binding protein [Chlamydiota bacterium]MBI3266973.1 nucleotidyltransferase substrate binding protein [Chlamydiota bacterium]
MAYRKKLQRSYQTLEAAITKLKEALQSDFEAKFEKDIWVEISTKRFEYTFESLWKFVKELLLEEGIETASPLSTFKEAFNLKWIDAKHEEIFPLMVKKRNEIVHIYSDDQASQISLLIKNTFAKAIFALFEKSKQRMGAFEK